MNTYEYYWFQAFRPFFVSAKVTTFSDADAPANRQWCPSWDRAIAWQEI